MHAQQDNSIDEWLNLMDSKSGAFNWSDFVFLNPPGRPPKPKPKPNSPSFVLFSLINLSAALAQDAIQRLENMSFRWVVSAGDHYFWKCCTLGICFKLDGINLQLLKYQYARSSTLPQRIEREKELFDNRTLAISILLRYNRFFLRASACCKSFWAGSCNLLNQRNFHSAN